MNENGKMTVETHSKNGRGGIKENDGGDEINQNIV
jgi:hypothetical protein